MNTYNTDKFTLKLIDEYVRIFNTMGVPEKVMEIGSLYGGFCNWLLDNKVKEVCAIDIDPKFEKKENLQVYKLSQDSHILSSIVDDFNPDMIIDDASHMGDLTYKTFRNCFHRLKSGSIYIIEDWAWYPNGGEWLIDNFNVVMDIYSKYTQMFSYAELLKKENPLRSIAIFVKK